MDVRRRDRLLPAALAAGCYLLALLQRPGWAVTDTKIDLHIDPWGFLADALAPWTTDISLGHVQSGQYGGYVFPMGPFFAVLRELGLSAWVTQRLWLGTLLFLSAWGVVKLLDALLGRPRGIAHVVAAAAFALNPYVMTYTSRVSVTLLAYAALPWLLLIVHRGLRERGWLWPAAFALIVTSSGGGINAAVTAWALVGPLLLLLYEPAMGFVRWRPAWTFAWRTALLGAVTSLWWVVPLAVQSKWGLPFLPYTEQPGTIWGTTSASESLRLMGFWLSYAGTGYGSVLHPYTANAHTLVFWAPGVVGSLLLPAVALGGFAWTRRWRYAPFFLAMTLLGVLIMIAGFPEGTPLRRGITFAYNHLVSLQTLRTTYKAGPLPALGLAVLAGMAARAAWGALAQRRPSLRPLVLVGAAAIVALSAWPFVRGKALDDQLTWKRIPAAWVQAADDLDAGLGDDHRAMVLPGQLFSSYAWGGTVDPVLPALASKPVAVRQVVPFADLRSVDLQWSTDALISQQRVVGDQLARLLDRQSVSAVVTGTDDDLGRSGALEPNAAARQLALGSLARPTKAYGPVKRKGARGGSLAAPLRLPQVRRYDRPGADPLVRLYPRDRATIVDGSAGGIVALAAFGPLPRDEALRYAADLSPAELRRLAANGSRVVVSDSNRRQVFVPSQLRANLGATLAPTDPISADGHQLNPWPDGSTDVQTVAQLTGVKSITAPFSPQVPQFAEHRPSAAMDGDPQTAWLADRTLGHDRWHLDVALEQRMDVPVLELMPYSDARGRVTAITVNGRRFAVHPGWNRLSVGLKGVDALSIGIADITHPPRAEGGAGGIRELRLAGVTVTEALRTPLVAERALVGAHLRHTPLTYVFQRTRGADPYHRDQLHGPWSAGLLRDEGDAEAGLRRLVSPPAARAWTAEAWVSVADTTADHVLDELVGGRVDGRFDSSMRYEGLARWRASSAFDGRPDTAWIGGWGGSVGRAWLSWTTPRAATVRTFELVAPGPVVRRPTRVRLTVDGVAGPAVAVGDDGRVTLPAPVRGRAFRLDVLAAAFPSSAGHDERSRRAVGIAELRGPGIPMVSPRRSGALAAGCDVALSVTARRAAGAVSARLRPSGTVSELDAGRPLRAGLCDGPISLPAGDQLLVAPPVGPFRVDLLELDSGAPEPLPAAAPAGAVVSAGTPGRGTRKDIRLDVTEPAWVVLGESFSTGWRATCDGRSLGRPVPLDGFAVGWPVDPGCRTVDVVFAGNAPVKWSALVSLVAALALLAFVVVALLRRRTRRPPPVGNLDTTTVLGLPNGEGEGLADPAPARLSLRTALAIGVAAALVGGFVFALRAGVVIGPLVAFVLWKGVDAKRLALAAGGLLGIVVPILYLAVPITDRGGFSSSAPNDRIAAHWVAVLAIVLLLLALYRALAGAKAERARRPKKRTPTMATH